MERTKRTAGMEIKNKDGGTGSLEWANREHDGDKDKQTALENAQKNHPPNAGIESILKGLTKEQRNRKDKIKTK